MSVTCASSSGARVYSSSPVRAKNSSQPFRVIAPRASAPHSRAPRVSRRVRRRRRHGGPPRDDVTGTAASPHHSPPPFGAAYASSPLPSRRATAKRDANGEDARRGGERAAAAAPAASTRDARDDAASYASPGFVSRDGTRTEGERYSESDKTLVARYDAMQTDFERETRGFAMAEVDETKRWFHFEDPPGVDVTANKPMHGRDVHMMSRRKDRASAGILRSAFESFSWKSFDVVGIIFTMFYLRNRPETITWGHAALSIVCTLGMLFRAMFMSVLVKRLREKAARLRGQPCPSELRWAAERTDDMPEKRPVGISLASGSSSGWRLRIAGTQLGHYPSAAEAWAAYPKATADAVAGLSP